MLEGPLSLPAVAAVVVVAVVAAVFVHELGHLLAAGALGGTKLRLRPGWPAFRVEAELPDLPGAAVVFYAGGAFANVGAAAALWGFGGVFALASIVQLLMAGASLLPIGDSDGAQLLRRGRRRPDQRDGV